MKRPAWVWTICAVLGLMTLMLAGSPAVSPARAELLPDEKQGLRRLVEAGERVRAQLRAEASAGNWVALQGLADRSERLIKATFYLGHAVVGRNPAERQALCQSEEPLDFENCLGPRSAYVAKAWENLDASGVWVNIDRSLSYADIWPADHLTLPKMSIGPHGPFQVAQTHLWRSAGQYGQDGLGDVIAALNDRTPCAVELLPSGEPCPQERDALAVGTLKQITLFQDGIMRAAARAARVGFTAEEVEEEELRPRDFALRPIDDVQAIGTQTNFHNCTLQLGQLGALPLAGAWPARIESATIHVGDAWRHASVWAQQYMRIPGVN